MNFAKKSCVPCEGGTPPLETDRAAQLIKEISGWQLLRDPPPRLQRKFRFRNFKDAMSFVNKVAALAEAEGHHPDFSISWNRVTLTLSTHAIKGLSENDFIMAAKINRLS